MAGTPELMPDKGRWPVDVDVWHVEIPAENQLLAPTRLYLDESERLRASRYRLSQDRMAFMLTRSALRELLGQRVGVGPESLRFSVSAYGRPALDGHTGLSFNVSHSGAHALIAISAARQVGIDIERIDPALDWRALIGLVCAGDEQRLLEMEPVWRQRQSFLRCWTAKEAILKALGLGITEGLRAISVNPCIEGVQSTNAKGLSPLVQTQALRFHWLIEIAGYVGCIAYGSAPVDDLDCV